jgi:hypothetical protein
MSFGCSLAALASLLAQAQAPALAATANSSPEPVLADVASYDGLYPTWEQTGLTHPSGTGEVGYTSAAWAVGRAQLGTQPYLDLYGTFNLQTKVALWRGRDSWAALQIGGYRIPVRAQERTIGQLHASLFDNPYDPVTLVPITLAASFRLSDRLLVHAASTLLVSRSDDPHYRTVSVGEGLLAELLASPHWAARLHAGVEGIGAEAQAHVGVSFAYSVRWLRLQAGYARRLPLHGQPGDGVPMFDGALLFR